MKNLTKFETKILIDCVPRCKQPALKIVVARLPVCEFSAVGILEVLEDCDPDLRKQVVMKLNEKSSLRAALRFK